MFLLIKYVHFNLSFIKISHLEMLPDEIQDANEEINFPTQTRRRQSVLSSSDPFHDALPIDCILVYDYSEINSDNELEMNHQQNHSQTQQRKKHRKSEDRRRKFEEYLSKKQGLILKRIVSLSSTKTIESKV